MKWVKRVVLAILALVILACLLGIAGFFYSYNYISTPPVSDPPQALLSLPASPQKPRSVQPAWLSAARRHQQSPLSVEDFLDPPLRFGPWTRWWWPGNLVTDQELRREMALFADTGIAGVEIQPFAITVSRKDKSSQQWREAGWDSPSFYRNLHTVLESARELNMEVDLNNGSGWPTGGPHVGLQDGLRQLLHSELLLSGPQRLEIQLPAPRMPIATFGAGLLGMLGDTPMQTFVPEERQLVAVVAARITDNQRSWQPWDFLDQITLAPDSVQVITAFVEGDQLKWEVPHGDWAVTALWQLPGGELVSGGYAHQRPGYVVDHLDADRMRANQDYLFREETGLAPYYGDPLRGFFNDSLEFRQERHWARGHLEEFEFRAGYDPRPFLAALIEPGKDQMPFHAANIVTRGIYDLGEQGERFLEDWDRVTSALFRERYFLTLQDWAKRRGIAHRLQAYGGPMDIISAAGESDIPEAEQLYAGGSEMFLKAVSSGAHIANKPIVSAESFIFVGRAFMTTPLKLKALADKAFAAGINQLVYHGTAYQIENHAARGYPQQDGWYPWQLGMLSTDFSENWPYWEHAPQINRYIARNQYLLRKGQPETDVLVLYPGLGFPQGYGNPDEPFDQGKFEGEEPLAIENAGPAVNRGAARMRDIWAHCRALEQDGLEWEWVNEEALLSASYTDGVLAVGQLRAQGLMLHAVDALAPAVAEKIARLANEGMPLRISGGIAQRQRGLLQWESGDQRVRTALSGLPNARAFPSGPIRFNHPHIKTLRRRLEDGDLLQFFSNTAAEPTTLELHLPGEQRQVTQLDAWQGKVQRRHTDSAGRLTLELPAYGSTYLWLSDSPRYEQAVRTMKIVNSIALPRWSLSVAGTEISSPGPLPGDWLDIPHLRDSGGPGEYRTRFELPADTHERLAAGHRIKLQLGKVFGAGTVTLNGVEMGAALIPPFSVDISTAVKSGTNELAFVLTPARKNRLVQAIAGGEPGWESPDLVGTSARVSAGLIGPASIIELAPTAASDVSIP